MWSSYNQCVESKKVVSGARVNVEGCRRVGLVVPSYSCLERLMFLSNDAFLALIVAPLVNKTPRYVKGKRRSVR